MIRYLPYIVSILVFVSTNAFVPSSVIRHPSSYSGHLSSVIRHPFNDLNRQSFYQAMEGNSRALVDSQIISLQSAPAGKYDAFLGALSMKKAGLGGSAPVKLHLFKEGRKMLEEAIRQDPDNAEYRFLRLMIQENAPGFLGYKNDTEKDSEQVRKMYKSLPEDLQAAIRQYNKKSKVLKLDLS